jgi:hypothetical protein
MYPDGFHVHAYPSGSRFCPAHERKFQTTFEGNTQAEATAGTAGRAAAGSLGSGSPRLCTAVVFPEGVGEGGGGRGARSIETAQSLWDTAVAIEIGALSGGAAAPQVRGKLEERAQTRQRHIHLRWRRAVCWRGTIGPRVSDTVVRFELHRDMAWRGPRRALNYVPAAAHARYPAIAPVARSTRTTCGALARMRGGGV